jgi:hypothetical protein
MQPGANRRLAKVPAKFRDEIQAIGGAVRKPASPAHCRVRGAKCAETIFCDFPGRLKTG